MNRKDRAIKANKEHDNHCHEIQQHPKILGLDDIVMSTSEALIFKPDGNIHRAPDNLLFDEKNKTIYNCEYKCHGNQGKAEKQLRESGMVINRLFPSYKVVNLYIHSDYKVEEIR